MSKIIYNDRAYGEIIGGATDTFIGTDGTNPGTSGLVPAPSTTDRNKYLKSDGTWAIPAGGGTGGTSNYEELANLPSINNQILLGNVELNELGLGNFITTFVLDLFYPIGSYYETSDADFDPNTAWGGTWEKSTHISEEESLLYTGSFTAGSITLNDDVKNYWRIAVTANDNDGSVKTFNVINDYANFYTYLDFQRITGAWYGKTMVATFNGKTMTANNNKEAYFSTVTSEGTYVTVKSIYGYKINTIIGWHRTA